MFLKCLEITGFKSFPEKIKLNFPVGITAVVGPNGSGKSNIADAFRWVMGEQSAKSLRGGKMEDVIFAGTQHRKPLGYAEVSMLIDNTNKMLPIEFSEVTVTRRLYRSGESEYQINGSHCRLKDVHALFMDTGVGREGYSIIGQGRVDEILSNKSEDRRYLFEEAAGIVKYKSRRNEALHKLNNEKQNLVRVDDLIEELSTQLQPLEEQAKQANIYLNLRDEYKKIHVNLFLNEVDAAEAEKKKSAELIENLSAQSKTEEDKLAQASEDLTYLKEQEIKAEAEYKEANRQIIEKITKIEKSESSIRITERISREIKEREDAILKKQNELEKEQDTQEELQKNVSEESEVKQKLSELSNLQDDLSFKEESLRATIVTVQQKFHGAKSKLKLLVEMEQEREGYFNSVKAVLSKKDSDSVFGKGILGTVGELLSVPQKYEQAISVTLGVAAQNIITTNQLDAQRAISYLKEQKAGRATFLPISSMRPRNTTSEMDRFLQEAGVIGIAKDLVSFDAVFMPVFSYLLGNIFVVESLPRAIELSKKYRQAYRLVTLEGDQLSPGGAMTGGSIGRQSSDLISRSRQITDLREQVAVLQKEAYSLDEELQKIKDKQKINADQTADFTERKINLGLKTQALQSTQNNIKQSNQELDLIKAQKVELEAELAELAGAAGEVSILRGQLEDKQREVADTETRISNMRKSIAKIEISQKEYMEAIAALSREGARLETRHEQLESESRRLHDEVWENYNITYNSAKALYNSEYNIAFLRKEEKRLRSEIAELGAVNVGAVEAYKNVHERHKFLSSQRDDILKAEEQLHEVIAELTKQMEQQFSSQFKVMAKHFQDVFKEVFGGGKAELIMSDPDHVLESGIEITAQPPGKKLQNLSLLSGGERALTAISLLFGILRMKPSPFCILDEIESALDDANVIRFAKFLKLHAVDTQFIVVTHRKGTMESADTLYGVTMQEMGISKLVSVDFR